MLSSFEYLQQLFNNRNPEDTTYPAVFIKTPANIEQPHPDEFDESAPATINVYMPASAEYAVSLQPRYVLTCVEFVEGRPVLLVRHQFQNLEHVLILPLLTLSTQHYLRTLRNKGAVMHMLFQAESASQSHLSRFIVASSSLSEATVSCLNLQKTEDIHAALKPLRAFAKREFPPSATSVTSIHHVLELVTPF